MGDANLRVFTPRVPEGYEWVLPLNDADFEVFRGFDGTSRQKNWKPVRVRVLKRDERGTPLLRADLPWLGDHVLVLTERAERTIGALLERWGELLPLECEDERLKVFNVCRVSDALDEKRSDIVRFDSGRIMTIRAHVFRAREIGDADVFKLSQMPRGSLYATDGFVDSFDSQQLQGTRFEAVWSDTSS